MSSKTSHAQIVLRSGANTRKFIIDIEENDTIGSLKSKLHAKSGVTADLMKIVFCGRNLDENTSIKSLSLGPQTSLTVVVIKQNETELNVPQKTNTPDASADDFENVGVANDNIYSLFYVFCKKCEDLRCGKLRAYCSDCNSSSVFFYEEPHGWNDVLGYKKLKVDCKGCEFGQTASVLFKCVKCGDSAIPLTQVRRNFDGNKTCVVCDENDFHQCLTLDCDHSCCIDCFTSYSQQMHAQQNFIAKPNVGLTIACPVYSCTGCIMDVHHFYLMGIDGYKNFQRRAAELFVAQQTERQHCPWPLCSATFFLTDENDDGDDAMVLCPECSRLFCRYCKCQDGCKCHEKVVDASLETIHRTSKACPRCRVPTERSGGCAHIHCTQCRYEWCFVCGKPWSDDCQWDHWFE